jgi:hypothetical protein
MSCLAKWNVLNASLNMLNQSHPSVIPVIARNLSGTAREKAIKTRLESEVQAFERYEKWSKCEGHAYHTILRYLSPEVSIHAAGIETSRDLWNDLEEKYRRMELAT